MIFEKTHLDIGLSQLLTKVDGEGFKRREGHSMRSRLFFIDLLELILLIGFNGVFLTSVLVPPVPGCVCRLCL